MTEQVQNESTSTEQVMLESELELTKQEPE